MDSLMQSQRNIQDLQRQIASGDKYTKLADNPSAIARSMQIKSTLNANDKYQENTTNAITMLRYADSAMNNVLDAAQVRRETARSTRHSSRTLLLKSRPTNR